MLRSSSSATAMRPSAASASVPKSAKRHTTVSHGGGGGGGAYHSLSPSIGICSSCKNSPSAATFDLLLLLLVLFSSAFLVASYLSQVARSLGPLLPDPPVPVPAPFRDAPYPYLAGLILFLLASLAAAAHLSCRLPWSRRRRCGNPLCRGLKKALEFDVQLQTEECIRSPDPVQSASWKEIDDLPWKGGQQGNNPDYECLRAELRRMSPPNGRAVLLFRSRCGCPVAKLEAWGPKRGRRHKKALANLAMEGDR